jgi:hypothetical protein
MYQSTITQSKVKKSIFDGTIVDGAFCFSIVERSRRRERERLVGHGSDGSGESLIVHDRLHRSGKDASINERSNQNDRQQRSMRLGSSMVSFGSSIVDSAAMVAPTRA